MSLVHIDKPAKKNCYATLWSYGEICVHCGCCAKDTKTRRLARLEHWTWWLEEQEHFDRWMDDPETRQIQEGNIKANIKEAKKRVRYYKTLVVMTEKWCPDCLGKGGVLAMDGDETTWCPTCGGTGIIPTVEPA